MPATNPPYEEEFKREAVDLYVSSGLTMKQISRELGISTSSLRKWRDDLLGKSEGREDAGGGLPNGASPAQVVEENRRLRRENERLRRQREILKKAAAILAEDPRASMS